MMITGKMTSIQINGVELKVNKWSFDLVDTIEDAGTVESINCTPLELSGSFELRAKTKTAKIDMLDMCKYLTKDMGNN